MTIDPGDLIARQAAATVRAMQLDADRKLAEPLIQEWRTLTEEQRTARVAAAEAEREQRNREATETAARARAEATARHVLVFDAASGGALREVIALHAPAANAHHACRGCTDEDAWDDFYGHEVAWPCRTFLLVEAALT